MSDRTQAAEPTGRSALPVTAIVLAVCLYVLWGGNTVAVKLGLQAVPPFYSGFFRFAIGVVCIAVWGRLMGIRLMPLRNEWKPLAGLSVLFTVQIGAMNWGYGLTSAMMGSILLSTYTFWAAFFSLFILPGHRLSRGQVLGMVIAFSGVLVAMSRDFNPADLALTDVGNLVVLTSGALLGLRLATSGRLLRRIDPARVTLWMMLFSLPVFAMGGTIFETIAWERLLWSPLLGLLYQGVVVAGFCISASYVLMQRYNPSVIVSFGFIEPISGVLVAAWILSETLTWHIGAAAVAVGLGLVLITRRG